MPSIKANSPLGRRQRDIEMSRPMRMSLLRADSSSFVAQARHELDTDYLRPFSLAKLAASVGVSPGHLLHSFSRTLGKPPRSYLIEVRVRRACELIAVGTPLKCVPAMVGFYDQAHMTRHFKPIMGVTPARYLFNLRHLSPSESNTELPMRIEL